MHAEKPADKPGVQTSEFWLTASALGATVMQALGVTGSVGDDVKTTVSGAALALISCWLGGHYMSGRLALKQQAEVRGRENKAAAASLPPEAPGSEA